MIIGLGPAAGLHGRAAPGPGRATVGLGALAVTVTGTVIAASTRSHVIT